MTQHQYQISEWDDIDDIDDYEGHREARPEEWGDDDNDVIPEDWPTYD